MKTISLSCENRCDQQTAKTFASEVSESVRHHESVSEFRRELNGASRRAYTFN